MLTGEQIIIRAAWEALLADQLQERRDLDATQAEQRETLYRENKDTFDSINVADLLRAPKVDHD